MVPSTQRRPEARADLPRVGLRGIREHLLAHGRAVDGQAQVHDAVAAARGRTRVDGQRHRVRARRRHERERTARRPAKCRGARPFGAVPSPAKNASSSSAMVAASPAASPPAASKGSSRASGAAQIVAGPASAMNRAATSDARPPRASEAPRTHRLRGRGGPRHRGAQRDLPGARRALRCRSGGGRLDGQTHQRGTGVPPLFWLFGESCG